MAWYLVTLALALTLFLLDRPTLADWVFAAAIGAAVVGSFSSLQGLLIWPVGLLVLLVRHRPRRYLLIWIVCALTTATLYFYHLNSFEYSDQTFVFSHPIEGLKFFLFLIGSIVGVELTSSPWPVIAFGGIIMVVAIVLVVQSAAAEGARQQSHWSGHDLLWVLFAAIITFGRAWFGLWAPSRYSTCGF